MEHTGGAGSYDCGSGEGMHSMAPANAIDSPVCLAMTSIAR